MPQGLVVSDQFEPAWRLSNDGQRLYLGIAPSARAPAAEGAPQPTSVDIWNWHDADCCNRCSGCARPKERNRSFRAVVHLADKRFVQLATPEFPTVNPGDDASRAIGTSDMTLTSRRCPGMRATATWLSSIQKPVSVSK